MQNTSTPIIVASFSYFSSSDDSGVFATSLSKEYLHVMKSFNLTRHQIVELAGMTRFSDVFYYELLYSHLSLS